MEEKPLISVIIPCYNRAHLIGETLQSLTNQTYSNWECIVVDDHSTDGSHEAVHDFIKKDQRVRWVRRPSEIAKGANSCRNFGMSCSNGDFLIFLDSDDLLAPFCMEQRINVMKKYPEIDFAVFPQLLFSKTPYDNRTLINIFNETCDLERFLCLFREPDIPWINNAPIWRHESLIQKNHLWNEKLPSYQDVAFHLFALLKGFKHLKVDTAPDSFWRIHSQDKIGNTVWASSRIITTFEFWVEVYKYMSEESILTRTRRKSILRNLSTTILFFIQSKQYKKAKALLEKLNKHGIANSEYRFQVNSYIYISILFSEKSMLQKIFLKILRVLYRKNFFEVKKGGFLKHKFN